MRIFPALADSYKRVPRGSKNGCHTKKGPGRFHMQGKPKKDD